MPDRNRDRHRHFRTDQLKTDIARRAVRGGAVTMGAQTIKVIAQFATIVLLARLLTPADFGLFAIVLALLTALELFKDMGLSSATVQRPEISNRQVSTLFWLNLALGAGMAILFAALGPALAWVYDSLILQEIAAATAITLLLTGIATQHLALLRRQMRFNAVAAIQTGAEIVAMGAAVIAALHGYGIWSLVVQRLVWSLAMLLGATLVSGWIPGRPGPYGEVREMVAFGANATGAMVLGRLASSFDKMIIGWYWGAAPLGLFERAQKLILMPVQNINTPLTTVALSMLSRLIDEPVRYRRAYVAVAERLAMGMAPLAALLVAAAEPVVTLVLGPQWTGAAEILSWLGLSLLYMPITFTLSWLYMSQDRTPEMLRANILNIALTLVGVVAALPFGPAMVAAVFAATGGLIRAPLLFWLVGRRGPVGAETFARILTLPILAAAFGTVLVSAVLQETTVQALPLPAQVGLLAMTAGLAALAVYAALPRSRRTILETLHLRHHLLPERSAHA